MVARSAEWSADGRIVTTSTIGTARGPVQVRQLGGTVDGIGMVVFHAPPVPRLGDQVTAHLAKTGTWVTELYRGQLRPGQSIAELPRMEFTRTTTQDSQVPLRWTSGCVFVRFSAEGTSHIPGQDEFGIMASAVDSWLNATSSCSYFDVLLEEPEDSEVGNDQINLIKFRDTEWGRPAVGNAPAAVYPPQAAGLTTLFFRDRPCPDDDPPPCPESNPGDGAIIDADIELNGVDFAISTGGNSSGNASCLSDLGNTLTHELGHLFGLDHTCFDGLPGQIRPVDGDGEPVPSCDEPNLSDEILEATMYNFQDCGETLKTTLEADDVAGFCAAYPLAADPNECKRVSADGGCCAVGGASLSDLGAPIALGLLALLAVGRRRA
ncbi:MAG: hypothetical protein KJO07_18590 [Deltaproteobacteria bacterium]|nr:hypothetical protein [Deltaproteobacteria bacterium]